MRTKQNKTHRCAYCGRAFSGGLETLHNIWGLGYVHVCPECFEGHFSQCDYCEMDAHNNQTFTLSNGRHACPDCYRALKAQGKS